MSLCIHIRFGFGFRLRFSLGFLRACNAVRSAGAGAGVLRGRTRVEGPFGFRGSGLLYTCVHTCVIMYDYVRRRRMHAFNLQLH